MSSKTDPITGPPGSDAAPLEKTSPSKEWYGRVLKQTSSSDEKKLMDSIRHDPPIPFQEKKLSRWERIKRYFSELKTGTGKERKKTESETAINALGTVIIQERQQTTRSDITTKMQVYHRLVAAHRNVYNSGLENTVVTQAETAITEMSKKNPPDETSFFASELMAGIQKAKAKIKEHSDTSSKLTSASEIQTKKQEIARMEIQLNHNIVTLHDKLLEFQKFKDSPATDSSAAFGSYKEKTSNVASQAMQHSQFHVPAAVNDPDMTKETFYSTFILAFIKTLTEASISNKKQMLLTELEGFLTSGTEAQQQLVKRFLAQGNTDNIDFLTAACKAVKESTDTTVLASRVKELSAMSTDSIHESMRALSFSTQTTQKTSIVKDIVTTVAKERAEIAAAIPLVQQKIILQGKSKESEAKGQLAQWLSAVVVQTAVTLVEECTDTDELAKELADIRGKLPAGHPMITEAEKKLQELTPPQDLSKKSQEQITILFTQKRTDLKAAIEAAKKDFEEATPLVEQAKTDLVTINSLIIAYKKLGQEPTAEQLSLIKRLESIRDQKWTTISELREATTQSSKCIEDLTPQFQKSLMKKYLAIGILLQKEGSDLIKEAAEHSGVDIAAQNINTALKEHKKSPPSESLEDNVKLAEKIEGWHGTIITAEVAIGVARSDRHVPQASADCTALQATLAAFSLQELKTLREDKDLPENKRLLADVFISKFEGSTDFKSIDEAIQALKSLEAKDENLEKTIKELSTKAKMAGADIKGLKEAQDLLRAIPKESSVSNIIIQYTSNREQAKRLIAQASIDIEQAESTRVTVILKLTEESTKLSLELKKYESFSDKDTTLKSLSEVLQEMITQFQKKLENPTQSNIELSDELKALKEAYSSFRVQVTAFVESQLKLWQETYWKKPTTLDSFLTRITSTIDLSAPVASQHSQAEREVFSDMNQALKEFRTSLNNPEKIVDLHTRFLNIKDGYFVEGRHKTLLQKAIMKQEENLSKKITTEQERLGKIFEKYFSNSSIPDELKMYEGALLQMQEQLEKLQRLDLHKAGISLDKISADTDIAIQHIQGRIQQLETTPTNTAQTQASNPKRKHTKLAVIEEERKTPL
jgi:transposase-like protein